MGEHSVVIVKEAQHIRKIEDLEVYLEQPQPFYHFSDLLQIHFRQA